MAKASLGPAKYITEKTFGARYEIDKAGMIRTNQTPANPEDNQSQSTITKSSMNLHSVTTDLDSDKADQNTDS
jgi:hypothetical protein